MRAPRAVSISPPIQVWTHVLLYENVVRVVGPFIAVALAEALSDPDDDDSGYEWREVLTIGAPPEHATIEYSDASVSVADAIEAARAYAEHVERFRRDNGIVASALVVEPPA